LSFIKHFDQGLYEQFLKQILLQNLWRLRIVILLNLKEGLQLSNKIRSKNSKFYLKRKNSRREFADKIIKTSLSELVSIFRLIISLTAYKFSDLIPIKF